MLVPGSKTHEHWVCDWHFLIFYISGMKTTIFRWRLVNLQLGIGGWPSLLPTRHRSWTSFPENKQTHDVFLDIFSISWYRMVLTGEDEFREIWCTKRFPKEMLSAMKLSSKTCLVAIIAAEFVHNNAFKNLEVFPHRFVHQEECWSLVPWVQWDERWVGVPRRARFCSMLGRQNKGHQLHVLYRGHFVCSF